MGIRQVGPVTSGEVVPTLVLRLHQSALVGSINEGTSTVYLKHKSSQSGNAVHGG